MSDPRCILTAGAARRRHGGERARARGSGEAALTEDRRSTRYEVEGDVCLRVLFTRSNDLKEVRGRLVNAGPGGLFIETADAIEPGALADLDLQLDGERLANTLGLVRWVKPGEGAGIEFFYGTDEEKAAIEGYLVGWVHRRREGRAAGGALRSDPRDS